MVDVLLVSKPIVPPWHDSSKNLVRDLAMHMHRHTPIVMSQRGVRLDMPRARIEPIYGAAAHGFSPALRDNARVGAFARKSAGECWHFFRPNPKTSNVARCRLAMRRAHDQTVCSARIAGAGAERGSRSASCSFCRSTRAGAFCPGIAPSRMPVRPAVAELTPLPVERVAARASGSVSEQRPLIGTRVISRSVAPPTSRRMR
jgi:hypothetical protein